MVFLLIRTSNEHFKHKTLSICNSGMLFSFFMPTILDAILIFDFFKQYMMQFLNWHGQMNQKKTVRTIREVSFLLHIHVLCSFLQYFPPFDGHFDFF